MRHVSVKTIIGTLWMIGDVKISEAVVKSWSQQKRAQVMRWATANIFRASDNDVKIPALPAVMKPYYDRCGHPVKVTA